MLTACQADVDEILEESPPDPTTGDSTVLEKIVVLDTTAVSGLDTVLIAKFQYDDLERIETLEIIERPEPWRNDTDLITRQNFHYTGDAPYPDEMEDLAMEAGQFYVANHHYYQYAGDLLVYDSSITTLHGGINYTTAKDSRVFKEGRFLVEERSYDAGGTLNFTRHSSNIVQRQDGNLIYELDTTFVGNYVSEKFSTFDSHPNPLKKVTLPYISHSLFYYDNLDFQLHHNSNNLIQREYISGWNASGQFTRRYHFTYRNDGYPLTRVEERYEKKIFFHYQK